MTKNNKHLQRDAKQQDEIKSPIPSLQLCALVGIRNLVVYTRYFGVPIFTYETWRAFTSDCDVNGKRLFSNDCSTNAYYMAATTILGLFGLSLIDNALAKLEKKLNGRDPNALEITLTLTGLNATTQAAIREKHANGHLKAGITFK